MKKHLSGLARLGWIALGAGLIGACTPLASDYAESEAAKQSEIEYVRMAQPLNFAKGKDQLAANEQRNLSEFLARRQLGYGDRVSVVVRRSDNPAEAALAKKRLERLSGALKELRLQGADVTIATDGDMPADQAMVVVGRYLITPPACPNWSKPPGYDFSNQPEPNLGCATATNFALMVADPGDIVEGRTLGPADGEQQTRAIQTYRGFKDDRTQIRPTVSLQPPYYPIEPRLLPRNELSTSGVSSQGAK